jgi:hypothetical protein
MARTVITRRDTQTGDRDHPIGVSNASNGSPTQAPDEYRDRLLKYIPAEIVAVYLAILNVLGLASLAPAELRRAQWVVFGILLLLTVPWQRRILSISKWQQIAIGSAAFVFWAMSLGDPFADGFVPAYRAVYGTAAMILFTFTVPLFEAKA